MDAPRHDRVRALVSRAFTPRRVQELALRITVLVRHYLEPALERRAFDFVTDFAGLLPMDVISEVIGVPAPDRDRVRHLADVLVHREEGVLDVPPAGVDAALTMAGYFTELIVEHRRRPADDLISALLEAEIDGERLSDDEVVSFLFLMVVAGNETTAKLLANAWYWAWRHPDEGAKALAAVSTVPEWIEETLRYDASTQMLARTATEDVALHGGCIAARDRVLLLVGAANRDSRVFPEAERYIVGRDTSQLVTFGFGRHYCLGASLARIEAQIALSELVARVADYDVEPSRARRVHSINVRGFSSLPTTVVPR
jgi:hypothetical protein